MRRTTILAALANGGLVLFAIGGVAWEAIKQLGNPHEVHGSIVAIVAAIGVAINLGAAMLFAKGESHMSEVFSIDTDDKIVSGPILGWIKKIK